ncbi:hypothetical protein L1987_13312 [Smallanthus sonchifolius]|uniref:Uncharacterized protein n=1 Tax=Smallanthus sonchifolius TaxID=185202 RepID=A0ACB9JG46_9ASTR|nr:hypothetical protein L1987_13312 [Smallanthus sonchifolius]
MIESRDELIYGFILWIYEVLILLPKKIPLTLLDVAVSLESLLQSLPEILGVILSSKAVNNSLVKAIIVSKMLLAHSQHSKSRAKALIPLEGPSGKANVVADAFSRKEHEKPKRVRALRLDLQIDLITRIKESQKFSLQEPNLEKEGLRGMIEQLVKVDDDILRMNKRI